MPEHIDVIRKFSKWAIVGVGLTSESVTVDDKKVIATIDPETCIFKVWVAETLIQEIICQNLLHANQQAMIFLNQKFNEITPEIIIKRLRGEVLDLQGRLQAAEQPKIEYAMPYPGDTVLDHGGAKITSIFKVKRSFMAVLSNGEVVPVSEFTKFRS